MIDSSSAPRSERPAASARTFTWIGLFIAFFGVLIVRQAVTYFYPAITVAAALWKESLIWICVVSLLFVIRCGENLSLRSVGIGTTTWIKSLLWGLALAVVCALVGGILVAVTHYGHGEKAEAFARLPVWL